MGEIYLIRHGQASFGTDNYDRLSELGRRQSLILGDYLSGLNVDFDCAYSGTLVRQVDTGRLVLSRCGAFSSADITAMPQFDEYPSDSVIQASARVMETDPEMRSHFRQYRTDRRSFQRVLEWAMLGWAAGAHSAPGLETWNDFAGRVRQGLRLVAEKNGRSKRVAVFTSGGSICAALSSALQLSPENSLRLAWVIRNTSVTVLKYNAERISLFSFNSVAHLEGEAEPGLVTYG